MRREVTSYRWFPSAFGESELLTGWAERLCLFPSGGRRKGVHPALDLHTLCLLILASSHEPLCIEEATEAWWGCAPRPEITQQVAGWKTWTVPSFYFINWRKDSGRGGYPSLRPLIPGMCDVHKTVMRWKSESWIQKEIFLCYKQQQS